MSFYYIYTERSSGQYSHIIHFGSKGYLLDDNSQNSILKLLNLQALILVKSLPLMHILLMVSY